MLSRILKLEALSFFSKCSELDVHFKNGIKNAEKLFVSEITEFEIVPQNSSYCDGGTGTQQSMC